jgi:hypothetical protein
MTLKIAMEGKPEYIWPVDFGFTTEERNVFNNYVVC